MIEARNTAGDGAENAEKSVADMTPVEVKAEIAAREAQTMTRRAALAKVGLRGGMAIFAAFSIDDLARKAATVLSQQSRDNKVIDDVARQMHNAGVAFADSPPECSGSVDNKNACLARSAVVFNDFVANHGTDYCKCEQANRDADCACNYHYDCTSIIGCNCGPTSCPQQKPCLRDL